MYLTKLASVQLPVWNVIKKYNQDPEDIFRRARLDPSLMHQPGARYALHKIDILWLEASRKINDPCFGLAVASHWHPSNFGTLGYAMLVSKSLRITLERLIRFHKVISDARYGELLEDRAAGLLTLNITASDNPDSPPAREDAALSWIMSVLRVNYNQELTPAAVDFTHPKPENSGRYYEYFRSPIRFNARSAAIHLPLDLVDQPLAGHNEQLDDFGEQMMIQYIESLDEQVLTSRVKKSIVERLPSGDATVDKVAAELFLSTRTLQRMLQQEGSSFLQLLNDTRKELAINYVRDKKLGLTEVAFLLGFSELSTFSRSFKRWTGTSPAQFRKAV